MRYEKNNTTGLSIMELPPQDRPREKLENKGALALSDLELLMILLSSGNAKRRVNEIALDLLTLLDTKVDATTDDIAKISGIGTAKASVISAALELGRRRFVKNGNTISTPNDIFLEVKHFATREQEQFIVIVLNGAHEVINIFTATIGLVNRALIHPREVFSDPIARRATAIILAHNHPSGILEPSREDITTTSRLAESGEILGIKVIDHLIFSTKSYYSFREHGLM
ncbi:RadC family protein [Bullifex porci]|uniref:DNA repair protein RadC n=1 Tax=Bullifex porci TaxID=2606638 RepID=A0A7X2PB99_9SPIO|nr:DNA repair protein RadC [Bullifex porci]MDD7589109.1 DNA repair protein RadC [Bullifex porci]MSU05745.1 DNA repair protein RadC [Bullifex porci]